MSPALFESGPLLSGSRNPYSWGVRTRSPSAVVASPGSVATWWILLPGAKQFKPDLIILDLAMPELNGIPWMVELLQALAWAVKVDDAARARASRKSEMRDFIVAPEVLRFSELEPRESARVVFRGPVPSPAHSGQALHRWRCSGSTPQLEKS